MSKCKRCGRNFENAKKLTRHRCPGTPKKLTVDEIPTPRVLNDRLVLHYHTKELGWLSSPKFHALIRKGVKVDYR
jgi:hypothetical protein